MIVASLLLAAAAAAAAAATVNPETDISAQVRVGKMLCSNPDLVTKSCSTIASYAAGKNGSSVETSELLLSPDQPLTLEASMAIQIKGSTICGVMTEADLQKGIVRFGGSPFPADRNALAMAKIGEKLKPMTGRQICEEIRIEDGRLMKYGQVERIDIKLPGKPVSWITAAGGYKVAPR